MRVFKSERSHQSRGWIDRTACELWDSWVSFWFTPVDPTPLCLLRILVGGMLVYSHIIWGIDLQAFLGPDGWNSAEVIREIQKEQWNSSFWWDVPVESMETVHHWCVGILVLFWVGFLTRITSVLAFAIHVSYCQRAAMSDFGLDQICGILLMYLTICPCGATYSLDGLLRQLWRKVRSTQRNRNAFAPAVSKSVAARLSTRLIQFHYCVIYFFAAIGKSQGESWWTGAAMWRVFANYEYQSADMTWLAWFPEILEFITHTAMLWELSFAYLIWVRPLRPLMLIFGVLMHLGIGAFLGMWTFGLTMVFGYVAFLQPDTVHAFIRLPFAIFCRRASRD